MDEITYKEFEWDPKDNEKFISQNVPKKKATFEPPKESRVLYTDGGSRILTLKNGSKFYLGAWAFYDQETKELVGGSEEKATNNQMELLANIRALEYLDNLGYPKDKWITIRLDSEYVRLGIIFWIKKWISQNWVRIARDGTAEEVKNKDLWKRLNELTQGRKIYWEHVNGHSGEEGNEKVDIKCGSCMDKYMSDNDLFTK